MVDLTKLLSKPKTDATKRPITQGNGATQGNIPTEHKNAVSGRIDPLKTKTAKTEENQGDVSLLQAGKLLQDRIMKGGRSTWAIFHALKRDAPAEEIALIAVKGLSLTTSDPLLFKKVAEVWREKYGMEIDDEPPYKITYCKQKE